MVTDRGGGVAKKSQWIFTHQIAKYDPHKDGNNEHRFPCYQQKIIIGQDYFAPPASVAIDSKARWLHHGKVNERYYQCFQIMNKLETYTGFKIQQYSTRRAYNISSYSTVVLFTHAQEWRTWNKIESRRKERQTNVAKTVHLGVSFSNLKSRPQSRVSNVHRWHNNLNVLWLGIIIGLQGYLRSKVNKLETN